MMEELLARFIFFVVLFCCLPLLLRIASELVQLVFALIAEAFIVVLDVLLRAATQALLIIAAFCFKQLSRGVLFMRILIAELRNPEDDHEHDDHGDDDDEFEEEYIVTPYARAVHLLGLDGEFSQAEFKRAFKRAIKAAHPDQGGTEARARAVTNAREIIRKHHGWAS